MSIPVEVVLYIFSYLNPQELLTCTYVCRCWSILGNDKTLWKQFCKEHIVGEYTIDIYQRSKLSYKQFYFWVNGTKYKDPLQKEHKYCYKIDNNPEDVKIIGKYAFFLMHLHKFSDGTDLWARAEKLYELGIAKANENNRRDLLLSYAELLSSVDIQKADAYYKILMREYKNNIILFSYIQFLVNFTNKFNLAESFYNMAIVSFRRNSIFYVHYANFLWRERNDNRAEHFYSFVAHQRPEYLHYFINYVKRKMPQVDRKALVQNSPLANMLTHDDLSIEHYSYYLRILAISYTEADDYEEAENIYKRCMQENIKDHTLYINYAELLLHIKDNFERAEELYEYVLHDYYGCHANVEVALIGLYLIQGKNKYLDILKRLLVEPHIQRDCQIYTEACIIYFIHSGKSDILSDIKYQIITNNIKPFLTVMFDAHIKWAHTNNKNNVEFIKLLCKAYNVEIPVSVLDVWDIWKNINVSPFEENVEDIDQELRDIFNK